MTAVTAVTAVRLIHIAITFCVASYTFMAATPSLCDDHRREEEIEENKKIKPDNKRNNNSNNNNNYSKPIENRKQIKNREYKKLCEQKSIKKEVGRHKNSTKAVFISAKSCDLTNFKSTDKGAVETKKLTVLPKTKKMQDTPKATNNKAKAKCDTKPKENKKSSNFSAINTNLKSFCDINIESLMLNNIKKFEVPKLENQFTANVNNQKLNTIETIRFSQGVGSKPQTTTLFDLIRQPPPPINHIKQPPIGTINHNKQPAFSRPTNESKQLKIKTTNQIKGKSLAPPPGLEAFSPNLNHWINSYNPIGTSSNSKSKFLPFITQNQGSGSGGHSPVSSKDDVEEEEIDFKLEDNQSEMFCLEDDILSDVKVDDISLAIKEDDHSSEISSYQGSLSPVQGCSSSPSSSTSSVSVVVNKQQQIFRNLQLAMILSKEVPQYDVESIAMALDNILEAKLTTNLTLNQFRDLVIEELSREDLEENEEDIFISDSEDEEVLLEEECPICTETMTEETIRLDICNHKFHNQCIKAWLLKQNSCPTCRRSVCKE